MTERTCSLPGCDKPARSGAAEWCKMHYHRWYRHGSTAKVATSFSTGRPRRYRTIAAEGHPLAGANGRAYEHRVVLYNLIGDGPHDCHWCGAVINWGPRGCYGELQPDHLNGDGGDNRPDNLVPSCRSCNTARGQQERSDKLREIGFWSNNDTIAACATQQRKPRVA